jgi:hypothetical protein
MADLQIVAYLDVQHNPDIFQSRLREILEQINKARHWLMRSFQRSQLAYKLIFAINDLLGPAKAALQIFVLARFNVWTLAEKRTTYVGQDDDAIFCQMYVGL